MLKKNKKERKVFVWTNHPLCCLFLSSSQVAGHTTFCWLTDLSTLCDYKDIVKFSWGDVMEWISPK